jgi:hypothetical protein
MAGLDIIMMKVDDLIPYPFNNKNHSSDQIEKIIQSLTEF